MIKTILFLCTGNTCRSAMAEGLFKKMLRDAYQYLESNGLVLFTSQASNPSGKLMKKIGKKQNGQSWNLFFRSPEYLRELMIDIGFRDVIISHDIWGIYEYCTGRKQ